MKETLTHAPAWINLEDIMLRTSHKRTNIVPFPLYEVPRVVTFIVTEVEWWLPGAGGREEWRVSV